jgi:multidrug efflux pump subunit AcrA (membrane-fusion protein)
MSTVSRTAQAAVDSEEIETTKSEKVLAVVLVVFFLIGGIWTYQRIDDEVARALAPTEVVLPAEEQAALARSSAAQDGLLHATQAEEQARADLELRREAYRTALDAGRPAAVLERAYRVAEERFAAAQQEVAAARAEVEAARPAAEAAAAHQQRLYQERFDRHELVAFVFRLGFVLSALAFGYWLLNRLRRRRSRYLPVALAWVGFSAILAFVMAGDYVTDYVDPLEFGPLVLAFAGIALTLVAFALLQRHLARRIPLRRVRKRECPFCGFPVGANEHCEGCGRAVVAECATCAAPRRVGTLHCGACGQA